MTRTFDEFSRLMADHLRVEPDVRRDDEAGLFDDWGLDSLQAFEMIIRIEALAGAMVPPPELPEMLTVGDAYEYYLSLLPGGA